MGVFLVTDGGRLVEMAEKPYELEDVLQARLSDYPELLASEEGLSLGGRTYILVRREAGLAAQVGSSGIWRVDHLFLDEEGTPTLVEVKRSANSQVRREVVGQMLDYAANAIAYWPVEQIRSEYEANCVSLGVDPIEGLRPVLREDEDPDAFWQRVKTNLEAGKLRLVFVSDEIPQELRRIVEYLNSQMRSTEVIAIEVKEYEGQGMKTLVSRQFGQTAAAQQAKGLREPTPRERLYEEFWTEFIPQLQARIPGWTRTKSPPRGSWIELPAGRGGIHYSANFPSTGRLRVELYVDPAQEELRQRAYLSLEQRREEIERRFGEPLAWEPLPERRASRIAYYRPGTIDERERWAEYADWFVASLQRLRDAIQPFVSEL